MNAIRLLIATLTLGAASVTGMPALAQATMDHSKMGMSKDMPWTDGEVRKLDKESGKVTLKHGEIKNLEMPGMTMVFTVKDKALLDKVQVNDKVRFVVVNESGKMVITDIQPVK
jgi:Cu(I)/Ag(I) efflux system periplasmic protein CusF